MHPLDATARDRRHGKDWWGLTPIRLIRTGAVAPEPGCIG
jgi:hypothetical protein